MFGHAERQEGLERGTCLIRDLPVDAAFSVAPGPAKALIEVVSMDPKGLGSVPREYPSWFGLVVGCRPGVRGELPTVAVAALV